MPYENINAKLNDETVIQIQKMLDEIQNQLPFLINLTPDERKQKGPYNRKRDLFNQKAFEIARDNTNLLPSNIDLIAWQADRKLLAQLNQLQKSIAQLHEGVGDTIIALQTEVSKTSSLYFKLLKVMAKLNIPGIDAMLESLRKK